MTLPWRLIKYIQTVWVDDLVMSFRGYVKNPILVFPSGSTASACGRGAPQCECFCSDRRAVKPPVRRRMGRSPRDSSEYDPGDTTLPPQGHRLCHHNGITDESVHAVQEADGLDDYVSTPPTHAPTETLRYSTVGGSCWDRESTGIGEPVFLVAPRRHHMPARISEHRGHLPRGVKAAHKNLLDTNYKDRNSRRDSAPDFPGNSAYKTFRSGSTHRGFLAKWSVLWGSSFGLQ